MSDEYYQLDFGRFFKAIYRQKWLVILCLCSSIVLALLIGKNRAPLYRARTSFWIRGMKSEQGVLFEKLIRLSFASQGGLLETGFATQIEIIKSPLVLEDVVKKLGLPSKTKERLKASVNLVSSSISVSRLKDTTILDLKAVHLSPEMAVKMANTVCEAYIEFDKKLFLEQEEKSLKSMEGQARLIREGIGKTNDLITEKIKSDMYLLLMEKIAEARLNLSLGQSQEVQLKIIDKAESAELLGNRQTLIIFLMGIMGLSLGIVLAIVIDNFKDRKRV